MTTTKYPLLPLALSLSTIPVLAIAIALNFPHVFGLPWAFMLGCGLICGTWAWGWVLGRTGVFDPLGLVGIFGLVFFMASPLLQLGWDWWSIIPSMADEATWVGLWAGLNLAGLTMLAFIVSRPAATSTPLPLLTLPPRTVYMALAIGAGIALLAFVFVLTQFDGIGGFMGSYDLRLQLGRGEYDPTKGLGVPMLLADSFRNLVAIAAVWWLKDKVWAKSWWVLPTLLVALLPVSLLVGSGLLGSRSSVVFTMFWTIGLYHFLVQPLARPMLIAGAVAGLTFMNVYQFYKFGGVEGLRNITNPIYRQNIEELRGDTEKYTLSRDLGRMDIQSFALKEYLSNPEFAFSLGRTYLVAPMAIVPSFIYPNQPPPVTLEKTNLLLGPGSFARDTFTSLLVGQAGEMFINFGLLGFLGFFALLAIYVRWLRSLIQRLQPHDIRWLALPILILLPIQFLISDSNVLVMFAARYLLLPTLILTAAIALHRHHQINT